MLGWAFYLAYRPRAVTSSRRSMVMWMNKAMLWAATVVILVSLCFPQMMTALFVAQDDFTPDMQRTVVTIEGMT